MYNQKVPTVFTPCFIATRSPRFGILELDKRILKDPIMVILEPTGHGVLTYLTLFGGGSSGILARVFCRTL